MACPKPAEGEKSDTAERREHALERLHRWEEAPQAVLATEAEASLCSAFALADLLKALLRR
jgi:hypothetical protein